MNNERNGRSAGGFVAACATAVLIAMAAASCSPEKSGTAGDSTRSSAGQAPGRISEIPVDEMPKVLTSTPPTYPEEARLKGVEGMVYVRALVAKDGNVSNAAADPSHPGSPLLEKAAVEAVSRWTFSPAKSKGEPVETWIVVPVRFQLDKDESGKLK